MIKLWHISINIAKDFTYSNGPSKESGSITQNTFTRQSQQNIPIEYIHIEA